MRADRGIRTLRCYLRLGWLLWALSSLWKSATAIVVRAYGCGRISRCHARSKCPLPNRQHPPLAGRANAKKTCRWSPAPTDRARSRLQSSNACCCPFCSAGRIPSIDRCSHRPEGPETGALGREAVHPLNGEFGVAWRRLRIVRHRSIPPFGYARITVSWIAMQWRTRLCREETNCLSGVSIS